VRVQALAQWIWACTSLCSWFTRSLKCTPHPILVGSLGSRDFPRWQQSLFPWRVFGFTKIFSALLVKIKLEAGKCNLESVKNFFHHYASKPEKMMMY